MPAPPVLLALLLCSAGPQTAAEDTAAPDPAVAAILAHWEAATADRVPISEAEKAAMRIGSAYSPELLELSFDLRGPIDASDLLDRYEWEVTAAYDSATFLQVTARDPLVRAFVSPMSVTAGVNGVPVYLSGGRELAGGETEHLYCGCSYCSPQYPIALVALASDDEAMLESLPTNPAESRREIARRRAKLQMRAMLQIGAVIRAQNAEPQSGTAERPPIRTALFTKPAGDEPTWKIERRVKKIPATQLVNNPLPKKGPRAE